jgi:hypothetical protein
MCHLPRRTLSTLRLPSHHGLLEMEVLAQACMLVVKGGLSPAESLWLLLESTSSSPSPSPSPHVAHSCTRSRPGPDPTVPVLFSHSQQVGGYDHEASTVRCTEVSPHSSVRGPLAATPL